jgi:hypothetical protein
MSIYTIRVTGSLYSATTGTKITSGQLLIRPATYIPVTTQYAPFAGGVVVPTTINVPIPASGDLDFALAAPRDVTYIVEYDSDPNDEDTPVELKPGYFKDEWTALANINVGYHDRVLIKSPMAYWRLDETSGTTAIDSSGKGRHGTYSGGITFGQTSALATIGAKAVAFDGTASQVQFSATSVIDNPVRFSVEAFAKATNAAVDQVIFGNEARSYSEVVRFDQPVGYWRLGEASGSVALDSGQTGVNGTYIGGVTLGQASPLTDGNLAADFNGSTGYVEVGDYADFTGTNPFSVEFWINLDTIHATTFKRIIAKDTGNDGWSIGYDPQSAADPGKVWFARRLSGTATEKRSTVQLATGSWAHVACTYDGSVQRMFINGSEQGTGLSSALSLIDHSSPLRIATQSNAVDPIDGKLDEVAIYSRALDPAEVVEHYNKALDCNYLGIFSSHARLSVFIDGAKRTVTGSSTLVNNTYYHLVGTYDGSDLKVYVNGVLDGTLSSVPGNSEFGAVPTYYIGRMGTVTPRRFTGTIDEVAFYDHALTSTEVSEHYSGRLAVPTSVDISSLF